MLSYLILVLICHKNEIMWFCGFGFHTPHFNNVQLYVGHHGGSKVLEGKASKLTMKEEMALYVTTIVM